MSTNAKDVAKNIFKFLTPIGVSPGDKHIGNAWSSILDNTIAPYSIKSAARNMSVGATNPLSVNFLTNADHRSNTNSNSARTKAASYNYDPNYSAGVLDKFSNPSSAGSAGQISNQFSSMLEKMYEMQSANNAAMQASAKQQMDFQKDQSSAQMAFNAQEAEKNRSWQEYMSNTAHVREMQDLKNAGLNPVLAANNGAAVTSGSAASASAMSGSKADVDTGMYNMMSSLISATASMENAKTNARANLDAARISAGTQQAIAKMQFSNNFLGNLISAARLFL